GGVTGGRYSAVRPSEHANASVARLELSRERQCLIGRSVVHDEKLEVAEGLRPRRGDGLGKEAIRVEGRHDNAHRRRWTEIHREFVTLFRQRESADFTRIAAVNLRIRASAMWAHSTACSAYAKSPAIDTAGHNRCSARQF